MNRLEVLIVEDEILVAMDLELIVVDTIPAAVVIASSVDEANAVPGPDVRFAFLDMHVTNGTTFEVAQRLLAKEVRIAFVSGSDPAALPEPLRGVPFIRKPYRREEVRRVLLEGLALRGSGSELAATY